MNLPDTCRTLGVTDQAWGQPLDDEVNFKLVYSSERITPGDKKNTFEMTIRIVSGKDEETRERIARAYEAIVLAGVFRASSIKVAEAAKVVENTQRGINIALINEVAMICDRR